MLKKALELKVEDIDPFGLRKCALMAAFTDDQPFYHAQSSSETVGTHTRGPWGKRHNKSYKNTGQIVRCSVLLMRGEIIVCKPNGASFSHKACIGFNRYHGNGFATALYYEGVESHPSAVNVPKIRTPPWQGYLLSLRTTPVGMPVVDSRASQAAEIIEGNITRTLPNFLPNKACGCRG